jgi:glycoside hydrolase-like protein
MSSLRGLNIRRLTTALVAGLILVAASVAGPVWPAPTSRAAGLQKLSGYGADSCTAPSLSQMRAFWTNTPYSYWGIYIGGSDRGCAQPNLTSSWVNSVIAMGWDLLPIWVGRQNPCTAGQRTYFSLNTSTAFAQGKSEALAAYNAWVKLQNTPSVPIDLDLEAPANDTAACRVATKSFVDGWVAQMHVAPAQFAGVYTSTCGGHLGDFATITHKPDFVDGADWDGNPSTRALSCVSTLFWTHVQRHKQYQGGHNQRENGVTLNIDSRCAYGPVYGAASRVTTSSACF